MLDDLQKQMTLALNEPNKDKQREMVQEIMDSPEMAQFKELFQNIWDCISGIIKVIYEPIKKIARLIIKQKRINSYRRQRIKHRRRVSNMSNHKKKKLKKRLARRAKVFDKFRTNKAWRNIFVKAGIVN
ncbi:hypothetical protein AW22_5283 [Bacillus cereus D17]|nr:hypothetical protein AW22_5283 [Bacillus cereus D17]